MSEKSSIERALVETSVTPRYRAKRLSATKAKSARNSPPASAAIAPTVATKGKLGILVKLLRDPKGATVEAMAAATGWQFHSVRGAMSGALKKGLGLSIASEKTPAGRVYRLVEGAGE